MSGGEDQYWVVVEGIRLAPRGGATVGLLCSRAIDNSHFEFD